MDSKTGVKWILTLYYGYEVPCFDLLTLNTNDKII